MIRYSLKCAADHSFESWFQNASGFEDQRQRSLVSCPTCGSTAVEKALMAPALGSDRKFPTGVPIETRNPLSIPQNERERALAELRRRIEENSDYVGMNFVAEARRIHSGDAPERTIHGEAKPEEAMQLIEDGVPVAPLPFRLGRKTN
jgi:hypothetical protein